MPEALVIRTVSLAFPTNQRLLDLLSKLKDKADRLRVYMASSAEEILVRKVFDNAADFLVDKLRVPQLTKIKDQIRIFICSANSEFAEKYYIDLPDGEAKNYYITKLIRDELNGVSNAERKITCINLQEIRRNCETEEQIRASLILTSIHELIHHFGDFGYEIDYKGEKCDARWLNDGVAEFLARGVMSKLYQKEYGNLSKKDLEEYDWFVSAVQELMRLVGGNTVVNAFLSRNFIAIERKVNELGVSDKFDVIIHEFQRKRKKKAGEEQEGEPEESVQRPERETQARKPAEKTGTKEVVVTGSGSPLAEDILRGDKMKEDEKSYGELLEHYRKKLTDLRERAKSTKTDEEWLAVSSEFNRVVDETKQKNPKLKEDLKELGRAVFRALHPKAHMDFHD